MTSESESESDMFIQIIAIIPTNAISFSGVYSTVNVPESTISTRCAMISGSGWGLFPYNLFPAAGSLHKLIPF
jgi:hypothetical protein